MSRELRIKVEEYLRIRRALGFKLEDHGRLLSAFIDHLEHIGASTLTVEAALQWATAPQGVQPFRTTPRFSDADRAKLMGGTLEKVYRWLPSR